MDANKFDMKQLTIKEVLKIKSVFGLSNAEAIIIFFGGAKCENI